MRRIVFVAILVFSFVSAGNMRSGYDFVQEMIKAIGVQETGCPNSLRNSANNGYVCATLPLSQDLTIIKNQWDLLAESASKKFGYVYTSKSKWASDSALGEYKFFNLNNDLHLVNILRQSAVMDSIIFNSTAGYSAEVTTAQSTILQTSPTTPAVAPAIQAPVTATPSRSYDLEVTRYLCQPPSNGYARVFGTVKNTSPRNFKFLEFSVEFFNGSQFVGQESSYVKADDLAPNAETTFETLTKVGAYTRCTLSFEDKNGKLNVKLP